MRRGPYWTTRDLGARVRAKGAGEGVPGAPRGPGARKGQG